MSSNPPPPRKRKWDVGPDDSVVPKSTAASAAATSSALPQPTSDIPPSSIPPPPPPSRKVEPPPKPASDVSNPRRSTSPPPAKRLSVDAAQKSALVAAKVEAMLKAKGLHVNVKPPSALADGTGTSADLSVLDEQDEEQQPDMLGYGKYVKDVDINESRNRYQLSKKETLKEIKATTGADVVVRGRYYPDRSLATGSDPPLHLHVIAPNQASLDKAIEHIHVLLKKEFIAAGAFGRTSFKVAIPIDPNVLPGFNIRSKIVGPGGANMKQIQMETGCRIQIRGRGSNFLEQNTGKELDEDIHLWIQGGGGPGALEAARKMCEELVGKIKAEWERVVKQAKNMGVPAPPPPPPPPGGAGAYYDPAAAYYGGMATAGYDAMGGYAAGYAQQAYYAQPGTYAQAGYYATNAYATGYYPQSYASGYQQPPPPPGNQPPPPPPPGQ